MRTIMVKELMVPIKKYAIPIFYVGAGHVFLYGAGDDGCLLRIGEGHQPGGGGGSRSGAGQISAFFPLLRPQYGRARNTFSRRSQCDHDGFLYRIRHIDQLFRLDAIRLAPGAALDHWIFGGLPHRWFSGGNSRAGSPGA